jgi:putative hydrolase of the HAD superfamily
MIAPPVRCILFDAVGTLMYADPPVHVAYAAAARPFGLLLGEAVIGWRFVEAFRKHYAHSVDGEECMTSEEIERDRWRAIVNAVFHELSPCEELFERLWHHFAQPTSWRLYHDVADCLRRLTELGLSQGVASNFDRRLITVCHGRPPLDKCDHYFVSSLIGFRKPALEFFRAIERATNLEPQQLMLIGDDLQADFLGAAAAGWHALHLNRDSNVTTASSIHSLAELS